MSKMEPESVRMLFQPSQTVDSGSEIRNDHSTSNFDLNQDTPKIYENPNLTRYHLYILTDAQANIPKKPTLSTNRSIPSFARSNVF